MMEQHPRVQALAAALHADNDWHFAYPEVEKITRDFLGVYEVGAETTTTDLVSRMWPEELARGEQITTRKRLYKALLALATKGLSDCATRGAERKRKHGTALVRPWLWHAPVVKPAPVYFNPASTYALGDQFLGRDGSVWERVS